MHKISDGFIHLIVRWIFLSKMLDVRKDAPGKVEIQLKIDYIWSVDRLIIVWPTNMSLLS